MAEEMMDTRPATHAGTVRQHGQPPKSWDATVGGGGSPPSSPDREALDSNGYCTASETAGSRHHRRGHKGSRGKKWLATARLDMPILS